MRKWRNGAKARNVSLLEMKWHGRVSKIQTERTQKDTQAMKKAKHHKRFCGNQNILLQGTDFGFPSDSATSFNSTTECSISFNGQLLWTWCGVFLSQELHTRNKFLQGVRLAKVLALRRTGSLGSQAPLRARNGASFYPSLVPSQPRSGPLRTWGGVVRKGLYFLHLD